MPRVIPLRARVVVVAAVLLSASGCTTISQYIHNGFKVGPNLDVPDGDTAPEWLDATDVRVRSDNDETSRWWTVFKDPTLDELVAHASAQNLTLREAGFRVLQSRAQLGISIGNLFPQQQGMGGGYQQEGYSRVANSSIGYQEQFYVQNTFGWNLAWEIDFWGRFRRAVTAARATLDASAANYNDVLVILMGDVASNYVIFRTLQQRLEYVQTNIDLQKRILEIAERRVKAGARGAADLEQARANLAQTSAQTPQLRILLRQASNRLCVLLGMHPIDLEQEMRPGPIPTAPASVAVGIPAQLLERRPDVRRAEFTAAAQAEQIGIAITDFYPAIAVNGTVGFLSENIDKLFTSPAVTGFIGPVFQWKLLNYGRIKHNVRAQQAKFQELVAAYQQTVIRANAEVEDGLVTFLRAQERAKLLEESVTHLKEAVNLVSRDYQRGAADFNRLALIQLNLVQQMDLQAQARGEIAQGLIRTYRALGGGWQLEGAAHDHVPAVRDHVPVEPPPPVAAPNPDEPNSLPPALPLLPPPALEPGGAARLENLPSAPVFPIRTSSTGATPLPAVAGAIKAVTPSLGATPAGDSVPLQAALTSASPGGASGR